MNVSLLQAIIFAIQQIENLDREKAEEKYLEESAMNEHEESQSAHSLSRQRRLSEKEREETMERVKPKRSRITGYV